MYSRCKLKRTKGFQSDIKIFSCHCNNSNIIKKMFSPLITEYILYYFKY